MKEIVSREPSNNAGTAYRRLDEKTEAKEAITFYLLLLLKTEGKTWPAPDLRGTGR